MATTYSVDIEFKAKGGQALQQVTKQAEDLRRTVDGTKLEVLNTALGVLPGRAGAAANGIVGLTRGLKDAQTQARATAAEITALQAALSAKKLQLIGKGGIGGEALKKEIAGIEQSLAGLGKGSGASAMALGAIGIAAIGTAAALGAVAASSVQFNNELERNRQQLTLFSNSAKVTDEIVKSLQTTADATSLGLPGLLEATKTLAAYGVEAKLAGTATKMLGDVALGDNEKLQRFAVNLGQIKSLGKAYTVDLKQFSQAGIPMFEALSRVTGNSTNEVMKMAEQGKISYGIVMQALQLLTKEGEKFYDGAKRGGTTMDAAFQQMQGSWEQLQIRIGKAATPAVVAMFEGIADALTNVGKAVDFAGKAFDNLSKGPLHDTINDIVWLTKVQDDFLKKNKAVALVLAYTMGGGNGLAREAYKQKNEEGKSKTSDRDRLAQNAEEQKKLAEATNKEMAASLKEERAKLDQEIASKKAKIDIETERSLVDARLGYEQQVADFRKQQLRAIADLERQVSDERKKQEFDNSQGQSRIDSLNRQIAGDIAIAEAAGRGGDTSGMQASQDMAKKLEQSARDRAEIEFNATQRKVNIERRISDFKVQTERQMGDMQTAYARQTDSILRGAAQKIGDLMVEGATKAKAILESAQMGGGDSGNSSNPSASGGAEIASPVNEQGKRWLQLIRYAEGTAGKDGYRTMFGGGKFTDMSRHPDKVVKSGGYSSAAAGAYQFMPGTWDSLGMSDFSPASQDRGARMLAQRHNVNILKDPINKANIAKLAPEWASLPTLGGGSFYGQPSKNIQDLLKKFGPSAPAASAGVKLGEPIEYFTGDKTSTGYRKDHGGSNYHDHLAYATAKEAKAAAELLNKNGIKTTELKGVNPVSTHSSSKSLHYQGLAFDVPGAQAPVGQEQALSRRVRGLLAPGGQIAAANKIVPTGGIPTNSAGLQQANAGLMDGAGGDARIQKLEKEKALTAEMAASYKNIQAGVDSTLKSATDKNKIDQATFALMQSGIKPELAGQLATNQQLIATKTGELEKMKEQAAQLLGEKNITIETRLERLGILDAIQGSLDAQPALLEALDAEAVKTQEIADARAKMQEAKDQAKSDAQGVSSTITGGLKDAIKAAVTGGDLKAALSNMLSGLGDKFLDMAMRPLEKMLTDQFMKIFDPGTAATVANTAALWANTTSRTGESAAGGIGGIAGIAKGLLGGLGGAGSGVGGAVGSYGSAMSATTFLPSFLAVGGPAQAGSPYIVGEKGPELFVPNASGSVIPADRTAAMARYQRQSGNSGGQGGESGQSSDLSPAGWQMNFETTQILGQDWISKDQLVAAMAETEKRATKAGAKAGAGQMAQKMRSSPSFRKQVGM